jgi:hypothetical protein
LIDAIISEEKQNCWLFLAVIWLSLWAKSEGFRRRPALLAVFSLY